MTLGLPHGQVELPDGPAVAFRIAEFLARTERERLRLFRLHLSSTVLRASPLLIELALMEGISISEAVRMIRPPEEWPWRPLDDYPPSLYRRSQQRKAWVGRANNREARQFQRTFMSPGVIIRGVDHPRGRFAIRPCAGVLGFSAGIGTCLLSAFGSSAMLRLPEAIPETLITAMPGRPLGQVVDHPLFANWPCRVIRVLQDDVDAGPTFMFRVPLVPIALHLGIDSLEDRS